MFYIAAILLPIVAAIQQFAVSYGYRGMKKNRALNEAFRLFILLMVIMTIISFIHWSVSK